MIIERLPVAKTVLDELEADAARRVILSGWVAQGPEVAAFEREFAAFVDAPLACAVSNGTTALHLALMALEVGPGDEVITVSHSFIATANAVRYCGATPVFVDIAAGSFNIDPSLIEAAITERTKAILCVHQLGMPCDLARILEIGETRGIPVVEDAACAIGSEILWFGRWERIGKAHGAIACFSFHPRKVITTGEGGMITTADPEFDRRIRLWRQHGMSMPASERHGAKKVAFESYPEIGFNYRMTDIQAAIGRVQLSRVPEIVAQRRAVAALYDELLRDVRSVVRPHEPEWAKSNWQSYCVQVPRAAEQRRVMQSLLDDGVDTRRGVMCSHREAPYSGMAVLPESERAQDTGIILPLYSGMTVDDVRIVVSALKRAIDATA